MLSLTDALNISIFVIFVGVSVVPFYIAGKLGRTSLGLVSLVLGLFAVTHGVFHLLLGLNVEELAFVVFGPLSTALLLVFAIFLYRRAS